jgi:intracellular sulfur oxidation DsrE/DsrF family protein
MHRRSLLWGVVSAVGTALAASRANAAADVASPAKPQEKPQENPQEKLKVVYHLSEADKVSFVLGNIQNHLDGVGGPDHVTIALVVHGPPLRAFHAASANPDITRRIGRFSKAGLELAACGNTMKSQNVAVKDLLPGFISADRGGVVRIAELQSQGYLYLRP